MGSYVHLRRKGLEGYISNFNSMVRNVGGVTGNAGIEVLPIFPVVREGLDKVGRELISMVREWIEWISESGGRVSMAKLSVTCGRDQEKEGGTFIWKPSFCLRVQEVRSVKDRLECDFG